MDAKHTEVALLIKQAFEKVSLGDGVGLWEGRALDDYADEKGIASARRRDEREDWSAIPIDDLCECESSLAFADPKGVRFLLPAFLLAELEDELPAGIVFYLTDSWNMEEHFSELDRKQREAVRQFLLAIMNDPNYEFDRPDIEKALANYWKD